MDDLDSRLNGQQLAKLCKQILPSQDDELLLAKLQELIPGHKLRLARMGDEWYRLGGIVDMQGKRIAQDLVEWTERTFINCGKNLQTLIDHARDEKLIAHDKLVIPCISLSKLGIRRKTLSRSISIKPMKFRIGF